jgi:hypothetical protein
MVFTHANRSQQQKKVEPNHPTRKEPTVNCFVAATDQGFDQSLFTIVPRRTRIAKSDPPPPSLFDLPLELPRWNRIEQATRFEEDAERWDGLA